MTDMAGWRKRIDEIDQQLVKLLNERSQCALEIGHLKKGMDLPAWQPQREAEILRNVATACHDARTGVWDQSDEGFDAMEMAAEEGLEILGSRPPHYDDPEQQP